MCMLQWKFVLFAAAIPGTVCVYALQYMVYYQLIQALGNTVSFVMTGASFSGIQVSLALCLLLFFFLFAWPQHACSGSHWEVDYSSLSFGLPALWRFPGGGGKGEDGGGGGGDVWVRYIPLLGLWHCVLSVTRRRGYSMHVVGAIW